MEKEQNFVADQVKNYGSKQVNERLRLTMAGG